VRLSTRAAFLALGSAALLVASLALVASLTTGSGGESSDAQTVKRVGLMHTGTDHVPPSLATLKARLKELGWIEGRNIELIFRNLEPDESEAQAMRFVLDRVDLIVAFEDTSIRAAQAATTGALGPIAKTRSRIPVVFLHPSDPVREGLVKSWTRPGGNLTGVFLARDLVAKQLELYQLLVPRLRRVLTLVDPDDPTTDRHLRDYQTAATELGRPLELVIREASTASDLRRVFRSLRPGEVDGAFVLSPKLRLNHSALIIRLAERAKLPVQSHLKQWAERGALFSYGADLAPIGRVGARYVDSILRGTSPSDLPIEVVPDVVFAINLETASKLGLQIPQEMIIRAHEVYRSSRP
jgi:putative tryptophan/tyrosine transport system substrate-binding protein